MVAAARAAEQIAVILQALMQNTVEAVVLAHIQPRQRLVVVLSTVEAAAGLATLQGRQIVVVVVVLGVAIRLAVAVLVEPMMVVAVVMERQEILVAAMEAAAEVTVLLLAWALVGMEECQVVEAAEEHGQFL